MMYPVETLVKANTILYSTNMLLKAVMVCDNLDTNLRKNMCKYSKGEYIYSKGEYNKHNCRV